MAKRDLGLAYRHKYQDLRDENLLLTENILSSYRVLNLMCLRRYPGCEAALTQGQELHQES